MPGILLPGPSLSPLGMGRAVAAAGAVIDPADSIGPTQGVGGWEFGYYQFGTVADFTTSGFVWNTPTANCWCGPLAFSTPVTGAVLMHPGVAGGNPPAVRRWTADRAGSAVIAGHYAKTNTSGGDGVTVQVVRTRSGSSTTLLSQFIAFNDGTGGDYSVPDTIQVGDLIDFICQPGANSDSDATNFSGTITF